MGRQLLTVDGQKAIPIAKYKKGCKLLAEGLHDVISELRKVEGILNGAENDVDQTCIAHRIKSLQGHSQELWRCVGAIGLTVRFVSMVKNQRMVIVPEE